MEILRNTGGPGAVTGVKRNPLSSVVVARRFRDDIESGAARRARDTHGYVHVHEWPMAYGAP
eukprot:3577916-Prymnesium_polylepis.1